MQEERNSGVRYGRELLRNYCQKLRLLLIGLLPPSVEDEDNDLPFRFRVFLVWSSRFASEKIKIDITGDLLEEYKLICTEVGREKANKWLVEQLNSSIRDFVKHYLSNSIKKLIARAHSVSSVVFLAFLTTLGMLHGQRDAPVKRGNLEVPPAYKAQPTITPEQTPVFQAVEEAKNISYDTRRRLSSSTLEKKKSPTPNIIPLVILTPYVVTRSATESVNGTVRLTVTTSQVRFRLVLPVESPKGLYRVNIEDPFGNRLWARSATSANGKTLTFQVNTRFLRNGDYRLSVLAESASGEYEAPIYYLITIKR